MSTRRPLHVSLKPDPADQLLRRSVEADVVRLVSALAADEITASSEDAYAAWRRHSEDHAASWLALYYDDEANRQALLRHLDLDD